MDYKNSIIKFLKDNDFRYDDIKNVKNNNILVRIYNLFANDVLFEPLGPVEMLNMGKYYYLKKDNDNAKKYFLMAIDNGCDMGYFWMGEYYSTNEDYENMAKYLSIGVEKNDIACAIVLGHFYDSIGDYSNTIKYLEKTTKENDLDEIRILGYAYFQIKDYNNALKYYFKGYEMGDIEMTKNLGSIYSILEDYDNAKKYLLIAIDGGCVLSMYYLGVIYEFNDKNYEQMEKYYMMAVKGGNIKSARALVAYYESTQLYIKILNIYVNYENDFSKGEIIKVFGIVMTQKLSPEDKKQFFHYLTTFNFEESDELPAGLELLIDTLKNNLEWKWC